VYLTRPGLLLSTQLHTDLQDVFVVQTQGCKRWRVYAPPEPATKLGANPLARGKGADVLEPATLGAPLIDTVMRPGQLLYVPAGFPHTTSTILDGAGSTDAAGAAAVGEGRAAEEAEPSVHLTLGVDTHLWGLSYARLREVALRRANAGPLTIEGRTLPTALGAEAFFSLQHPLPLGFLAARPARTAADAGAAGASGVARRGAARGALGARIAHDAAARFLEVEPLRWAAHAGAPAGLSAELGLEACAQRLLQHHAAVMRACRALCEGGAAGLAADAARAMPPLARAEPLMGALDDAQDALAAWADGRADGAPQTPAGAARAGQATAAGGSAAQSQEAAPALAGSSKPDKGKKAKSSRGFGT
jgi:hypothetical protein